MNDAEFRAIQRLYDAKKATPQQIYRFRSECVRLGRPELALPFMIGDLVEVDVSEDIHRLWRADGRFMIVVDDIVGTAVVKSGRGMWGKAYGDVVTLVEPVKPA